MSKVPDNFRQAIIFLSQQFKNKNYAIRGTAGLFLQGIDMNVGDIDIICDEKTANECNEIFKSEVVVPVSYKVSDQFKSHYGKFIIDNVEVEIMGNWQIKDKKGIWSEVYDGTGALEIKLDGNIIMVTSVQTELKMYAQMGRWSALQKVKREYEALKNSRQDELPL